MDISMDIYTKFDLHIHTIASSRTKSGDKAVVENSTLENIEILVQKLIENRVNMVALTDHDIFDKDLYIELKKQELENNTIYKVLPGFEIDLDISGKIVHVVCIFDDSDVNHIEKITKGFTQRTSYTVDDLASILRKIELGTVLIAHQKCDYTSEKQQKTSLSYAGKDEFYRFISCEFFDALEIQNSKVEGILKSRFETDKISNVNLVVGSDCHEWIAYPAHHSGRNPAELMYIKALPTFQGLVMAITDNSRIYKYIEPNKENTLKEIQLEVNSNTVTLPLSDKINVIIGDNSVGKSTLVKYLSGAAEKGAIEFLSSHNVKILTNQLSNEYFSFSSQGKIREMFESNEEKLSIKQKFKDYFKPIDKEKYQTTIKQILMYYKQVWERNENISNNLQMLNRKLYIPIFTEKDKHYLSIEDNLLKEKNEYLGLVKIFEELYEKFKSFNEYRSIISPDDINELQRLRKSLITLGKNYYNLNLIRETEEQIKSVFGMVSKQYTEEIGKISNSDELTLNTFRSEYQKSIDSICKDIEYKSSIIGNVWDGFKEFKIEETVNQFGKYCFINKAVKNEIITRDLITNYISKYIETSKPLELLTVTEILNSIKGKKINEQTAENISQYLNIIYQKIICDYMTTTVEIKQGSDMLNESNSAGINALYYIDILSETYSKPIFIIDQPEDDVSQSRISSNLIPSLKNLANKAQIIIVTHNPQLVVNLDVDNVIVIKKQDNAINFYSGALELKNDNYSILDLVAKTLDGGADVIKKRWKRYDKTSSL